MDADDIEWIRAICIIAGAPGRAIEFLERGLSRSQVVDELHPLVHGAPRPSSFAPWPVLFSGNWSLNDPDLDDVDLRD